MRADRLLSILLLLQVNGQMRAGDLARRLEVSERTIQRDMDALSMAGVPLVADRGTGGGWRLLERYRTDLTGLNTHEIQALFLTRPPRLLADLGLDKAEEGALIKLLAALPSNHRSAADLLRERIHIDPTGWHPTEESVPYLPHLQDALWHDRRILLGYRRQDGTNVERLVDPLGLVAKGSAWYLVAAVGDDLRTYRASRVASVDLTDEPAQRPPDFDLVAFWEDFTASFVTRLPRYPAIVRIDPAILDRLRLAGRFSRIEAISEPEADGWLTVHMRFELVEDARECALSFGPALQVIDPPDLRADVLKALEEALDRYHK